MALYHDARHSCQVIAVEENKVIHLTDICPFTSINLYMEVNIPVLLSARKIKEKEVIELMKNDKVIKRKLITRPQVAEFLTKRWNIFIGFFGREYCLDPFKGENTIIYIKPRVNIKNNHVDPKNTIIDCWEVIIS